MPVTEHVRNAIRGSRNAFKKYWPKARKTFSNFRPQVLKSEKLRSHRPDPEAWFREPNSSDKNASLSSVDAEDDDDNLQYLGLAGLNRSNRLGWSFFCGEIAKLNERFLC
ncbi:hypothetical protein JCM5296_006590 [Sporobolomyces johnsonii]